MPPLLADFSHARACKPFCEKYLTLPSAQKHIVSFCAKTLGLQANRYLSKVAKGREILDFTAFCSRDVGFKPLALRMRTVCFPGLCAYDGPIA